MSGIDEVAVVSDGNGCVANFEVCVCPNILGVVVDD